MIFLLSTKYLSSFVLYNSMLSMIFRIVITILCQLPKVGSETASSLLSLVFTTHQVISTLYISFCLSVSLYCCHPPTLSSSTFLSSLVFSLSLDMTTIFSTCFCVFFVFSAHLVLCFLFRPWNFTYSFVQSYFMGLSFLSFF